MSLLKVTFSFIFSALYFSLAPPPVYGAAPPHDAYLVRPGDSLWKIASRTHVYGSPWKWPLIYDANPQIANPELIEVGWRLSVPLAPSPEAVMVAMEQARQYDGGAELPAPAPAMALADIRVMDDSLPVPHAAANGPVDPFAAVLVLGVFVFTGLLILTYSFVPLFLAWTRMDEPMLGTELASEALPQAPVEPELQPQPTESEEIVRAMEGQDPPRPAWRVAEDGELVREEFKEEGREKMAA
jgi:hypothetical protein